MGLLLRRSSLKYQFLCCCAAVVAGMIFSGCRAAADNRPLQLAEDTVYQLPAGAGVRAEKIGDGPKGVYIFTPEGKSGDLPLILFLHGGCGTDPGIYGGWIDHLARTSKIVVFPVFARQGCDTRTSVDKVQRNIVDGVRVAIEYLQQAGGVQPDLNRFAVVGHSFGGGLSAQIAALAPRVGLPIPRAVMPVMPGWRNNRGYPIENVTGISPSTFLLVVEGDQDQFQDTRQGWAIFSETTQIPAQQKAYVQLGSKQPGGRSLKADHYAPQAPDERYTYEQKTAGRKAIGGLLKGLAGVRDGETDSLDSSGFWLLFDNLTAAAFGSGCDIDCVLKRSRKSGAVNLNAKSATSE